MENFREQIAMLHLEDIETPEDNLRPVKQRFSMDPKEVNPQTGKRKYAKHKENSMTGHHPMSEENKQKRSEQMREFWANPVNREKMVKSMKGAEHKKFGKLRPDAWQSQPRTPEYRQYISSYMRKYYEEHPEAREKQAERMKTVKKHEWSESERKQISKRQKGDRWIHNADYTQEAKIHKDAPIPDGWSLGRKKRSEESKQKASETMKQLWKDFRERQETENNATAETM